MESLCNALVQECSKTYTEKHAGEHLRPKPKEESAATDSISAISSQSEQKPAQAVYSMPVLV